MALRSLLEARARLLPRPSWVALFTRAYSLVAARRPELRRAFLPWPVPRLYEHPESVAAVIIERDVAGEPVVLPAILAGPERQSLIEISEWIRGCKVRPISEVRSFRRALRVARWPMPFRRFAWWMALEWLGPTRAREFGTFGVSVTAADGAETLALRSPLTTTLHYGRFESDGRLAVRLTFDHRVLDGAAAARALVDLEATLHGEVLAELLSLVQAAA